MVGAEEWGLYFSLFSFSLVLNVFLDLGLTNFNQRNISRNQHMVGRYFSNLIYIKLFLGILYFFIAISAALIIGYDARQVRLLYFLVLNQFLISFILYLRSNISGLQFYYIDSLLSVLDKTLMVIICGLLLWGNITPTPFRIEWFIYGQTAAYIITAFVALAVALVKTKGYCEVMKVRFDLLQLRIMSKEALPYAILVLLMAGYNRMDSVLLERMLQNGKEQVGIYGQAFRLFDALNMFGFLFAGLLLPMFSKMLKKKEAIGQLVQFSTLLIVIPAVAIAISSFFYSEPIIHLLYHDHVAQSARLLPWLMLSFVGVSVTYIYGTLLTANGSIKLLNLMALGGLSLNLLLNGFLIPGFQALGSAWASAITQILTAGVQIWIALRVFQMKPNWGILSRIIIFALAVMFMGWGSLFLPLKWIWSLSLVFAGAIVAAFLLRLLNLKGIYQLLRQTET